MTTDKYIDIPRLVRETVKGIGYTRAKYGFDAETCGVIVAIDEQSPDIAQGVDHAYEVQHDPGDDDPLDAVGAGDQGMMFGYASNETRELMPLPIMLAHRITKRLSEVRKADVLPYLRPDGKAQVSIRYEVDADGRQRPVEIERVLISTQHREGLDPEAMIKPDLIEQVLRPILPKEFYDEKQLEDPNFVYVNPTGKFVIGGPMGDTGLTGRKIIVDTYGGAAPHGGGAFSGKDPTKVDRSARVRGALRREERRRRRARRPLPDPGRLRDRRRASVLDPRRDVRHREAAGRSHRGARQGALRPASRRDPARPRPAPPDLCEDRRVRPLRPRRPRLHVGAHRQGRSAPRGRRPRDRDRRRRRRAPSYPGRLVRLGLTHASGRTANGARRPKRAIHQPAPVTALQP